eukprot:3927576-Pleurochrysis_carterae.AAC.1
MGVEDLPDQLKKHKLLGKTGFTFNLPNRTAYVLQLQTLLSRPTRIRTTSRTATPASTAAAFGAVRLTVQGRKRRRGLRSYMAYEWIEEEEEALEVEAVVGKI